jgi:hypothetical protein
MSDQQMMTDLNGNQVPIPQGATFGEPVTDATPASAVPASPAGPGVASTPASDNMMTDLNGNRVPIPQGATFGAPAATASLSQEQQLQDRIHATTQHIAGLKQAQIDTSPAERDLVDTQKLLGQLQGVDTNQPGWISKLNLGTPTAGTTGGLETTAQQAAGVAKETGASLWATAKDLLSRALDPAMVYHNYQAARAEYKSHEQAVAEAENAKLAQTNRLTELKSNIDDYLKHPDRESGNLVANTILAAIPLHVAGEFAAGETSGVTHIFDPATGELSPVSKPGRIQQVLQGEKVAQPAAQQAVRRAVQGSAEAAGTADKALASNIQTQPLLKGNTTVMDEHLSALQKQEQSAYSKMDEAAGFDVKAEKQQLANDQYKLKQLGNTEADIAQKGNLIDSINDSQARIADAEAKMKEAGVDPDAADALHKQRLAGNDFRKVLIKSTSPDGTVNVDGLLKASKNLRFAKYGDRLSQFFGSSEAADNFMSDLEGAQKLGQQALTKQKIGVLVGKYVGLPILGAATGYETYQALKPTK